jgi:hypothetical protein
MAPTEGICSGSPTQPSPGAAKSYVYRTLSILNECIDHVLTTLRALTRSSFADRDSLKNARNAFEEIRAGVNAGIVERLSERERLDEGRFWKQRRTSERKWHDPDDVYIEVERREVERRKRGLPARIGIIHDEVARPEVTAPRALKKVPKRPGRKARRNR